MKFCLKTIFLLLFVSANGLFAKFIDFEAQFQASPDKQQAWQTMADKIDRTTDDLGLPIDENIKDTVIVLNLLGFETTASCEGHTDHGCCYPWVDIEIGDKAVFEKFAADLRDLWEEVAKQGRSFDSLDNDEIMSPLLSRAEELWKSKNNYFLEQARPVVQLLREFYQSHAPSFDAILFPKELGDELRIYSIDGDWQVLSTEEKKSKLAAYRLEMERFTDFLIERFLNH